MKIMNIKTEYLDDPLGIDITSPRIFWSLEGVTHQTAYRVDYALNGVKKSSGIIKSSSMHHDFKEEFSSRDHIDFTITIFEGENSTTSEPHSFEMGLLHKEDWKASWISGNYSAGKKLRYPADYFRKEFQVKDISSARLYASALGVYEAYLNGIRVGDFIMAPGSTDYRKRVQYQTYDVTKLLRKGNNELTVILGDGWYRGSIGAKGRRCIYGTQTACILQLEMKDDSGNVSCISSDSSFFWCNDGPIRFNDFKDGERVDARLAPSYKDHAVLVKKSVNLSASDNTFAKEQESFKPVSETISSSGCHIYEFKQNLAGYLSFSCLAHEGDTIDVVLGEMLDEGGEVTLHNVQCNVKGRLTPLQEIHFICKEGHNEYHPKFMYAGFRYASIRTNVKMNMEDIHQIALYTDIRKASAFQCSNELINIFERNTLWSLKSNSFDVPTDCPTRERMGWTGDSQVFFNTASYLTDYAAFARKHLMDVYDRQDENGRLPQIAPYNAEDWYMNVMNGSVGWADVGVLIPYRFYKKYGDERLLVQYYDRMVKYAEFMISRTGRAKGIYSIYAKPLHLSKENRRFGVNTGQSYGEWAEPNDVKAFVWTDFCMPHPEESMAYTYYILTLMNEIGEIIGRNENRERFAYYAEGVKRAYQELVTKPAYTLDTNRQAKLVRPLYMNLLTKEQEAFAKLRLIQALDSYKWRLGTGFLSTPFILDVLQDMDKEYAYKLLENEEMPGWLYMAKNNTGTIWEGWEGPKAQLGISSLNHYSKGAMTEWLYHSMCGINVDGENQFLLKPVIGGKETYAKASYQSIYGNVSLSWKREEGAVIFDFTVPSNTTAEFQYGDYRKSCSAGSYHLELKEI